MSFNGIQVEEKVISKNSKDWTYFYYMRFRTHYGFSCGLWKDEVFIKFKLWGS